MTTGIICLVLIVVCVLGIKSYVKRLSSGCCGAGGDKKEKKVKVEDRDVDHYPFTAAVKVDGMTCGNCLRWVENALNRLEGVWASGELSGGIITVRMKQEIEEDRIRQAVREAGYCVLSVKKIS